MSVGLCDVPENIQIEWCHLKICYHRLEKQKQFSILFHLQFEKVFKSKICGNENPSMLPKICFHMSPPALWTSLLHSAPHSFTLHPGADPALEFGEGHLVKKILGAKPPGNFFVTTPSKLSENVGNALSCVFNISSIALFEIVFGWLFTRNFSQKHLYKTQLILRALES